MTTPAPTLDLSGLSPEAVAAVAAVVEQLRAVQTPPPGRTHLRDGETPEEWITRLDAWIASHQPLGYAVETDRGVLNERDGAQ